MANQLKEKQKKLKKLRTRNIILNYCCPLKLFEPKN